MIEQLGDYELVRHLATGGMAEIFIARQTGALAFQGELAIKRILPHLAREDRFISMFLDEARIAAQLRHPNIVQIYELGEQAGEYFIAMEYIEGGDLADLLDRAEERNVEIPIAMSVRIIADVLAALDYAHELSSAEGKPLEIVHRDISPHNVLIGSDGIIKLVDFGIAHAVERHAKTETGLVKGKLSYMSPEQIEQHGVDRRADLFSAGALLYELLVGQPPFGRELAAVNSILNEPPPDPQALRPDVPDELVDVLNRALEKDPDDRYQTARQMLEALEDVLRVFDKRVEPAEVAQFATALITGGPIAGFDDVSQNIPRAIGQEAMLRAAYAVGTPVPRDPDDTVVDSSPPSALIPVDEDSPTTPRLGAAVAAVQRVRSNEYTFSGVRERPPAKWFAAAAVGLVVVGGAVAVLGSSSAQTARETVEEDPAMKQVAVIELAPQYVDAGDDEYWEDDEGFTFGEDELELTQLEGWVAALNPVQVDQMLALNFERDDGDYLWSVHGERLPNEVLGAQAPVNPGDPRAPKLLGLEDLDEAVLKPKPRKKKKRKTKRRRPKPKHVASRTEKKPVEKTPPVNDTTPVKSAPTKAPAKKAPSKKKKKKDKKNDLRIIDQAVPY